MKDVVVRQMHGDEILGAMYLLPAYAFSATPPLPDRAERDEILRERKGVTYFGVYEGGKVVAVAASSQMTQQVRGALLPMGGIWGVATHPAARRRGYSKAVLAALLEHLQENGTPLSGLYPFRESFYERLGYVTFPLTRIARIQPHNLLPVLDLNLPGSVKLDLIADGYDTYRDFLFKMQARTHGMAIFDHSNLVNVQRSNAQWLARAYNQDDLVGVLMYDLKGDEVTKFKLRALRFYYSTVEGRYLLLSWLAKHIDQASEIEVWLAPDEHPETWLADLKVRIETGERAPMGRALDVSLLSGMQTGPGAFTARIQDSLCPWNEGIWRFESVEGRLQVEAAGRADCELSIHAVGVLIYGTHAPEMFSLRGWGQPPAEVQAAMRSMFPAKLPFIHEYF